MAPRSPPPTDDPDEELERDRSLIEQIRAGDMTAFNGFIREEWKPLVYFVRQSVSSLDDAQDFAQEAFFRVWTRRDTLRPEGRLRAYLFQVARNLVIDELRKREVRDRWARDPEQTACEPSFSVEPLDRLEQEELLRVVEQAMTRLPPRRREAFTLVHAHGFSYREAARIMGISPQTLADQVSTALNQLRRWLVGAASLIL